MSGRSAARRWQPRANVAHLADDALRARPGEPALIAEGFALSHAQLHERAARVAGGLRALGIARGDVVALAVGNDPRFAELVVGIARAGAVSLLVNVKLGPSALAHVTAHSEAKLIVGAQARADRVAAMRDGAPAVRQVVAVGELPGALPYAEAFEQAAPSAEVADVEPDDVAMLMYTSGSTGGPKGVMLSHSNTWWHTRSVARVFLLDAGDCALVMGPLYHANALWASLLPMLYTGGVIVLLDGFDAAAAMSAIDRHRVTYTSGTPSMYALLLAEAERASYDISSIELLLCGSAPVPEELLRRIVERFGCEVCETYGLTEGGANVMTPRWGIKKVGSTGLPLPDVEIKVCDPEDPASECGSDEVGELWTRSPGNALGYLKQPDATAKSFTADGWLRTGDLVRRDEQGYVYVSGRVDDMISVGGENVYPKDVETVLLQHPAVEDAAVLPVEHPVKGHAPVAWIVLRVGAVASEDELRRFFLERGPAYAHPRRVFFRDAIPQFGTNKVDSALLRRETDERLPDGLATAGKRP